MAKVIHVHALLLAFLRLKDVDPFSAFGKSYSLSRALQGLFVFPRLAHVDPLSALYPVPHFPALTRFAALRKSDSFSIPWQRILDLRCSDKVTHLKLPVKSLVKPSFSRALNGD